MPAGLLGHRLVSTAAGTQLWAFQSPFAADLFPFLANIAGMPANDPSFYSPRWRAMNDGSTDSKQTLNGLFYVNTPELFFHFRFRGNN